MRNYEAIQGLPGLPTSGGRHYKPVLATSFRIKAAVRSANRANRERLRSVNDCVERWACQSAHPIYKRRGVCTYACVRLYVFHMCTCVCKHRRATTRAHTRAPRAIVTRDASPSDRVRPAIGYRRGVTDFTGRRANEKLVGCEVTRGQRLHPPFPRLSPPTIPQDTPRRQPRPVAFIRHANHRRLPRARRSKYPAGEISLGSITGLRLLPWSWSRSSSELLSDRSASTLSWKSSPTLPLFNEHWVSCNRDTRRRETDLDWHSPALVIGERYSYLF